MNSDFPTFLQNYKRVLNGCELVEIWSTFEMDAGYTASVFEFGNSLVTMAEMGVDTHCALSAKNEDCIAAAKDFYKRVADAGPTAAMDILGQLLVIWCNNTLEKHKYYINYLIKFQEQFQRKRKTIFAKNKMIF